MEGGCKYQNTVIILPLMLPQVPTCQHLNNRHLVSSLNVTYSGPALHDCLSEQSLDKYNSGPEWSWAGTWVLSFAVWDRLDIADRVWKMLNITDSALMFVASCSVINLPLHTEWLPHSCYYVINIYYVTLSGNKNRYDCVA